MSATPEPTERAQRSLRAFFSWVRRPSLWLIGVLLLLVLFAVLLRRMNVEIQRTQREFSERIAESVEQAKVAGKKAEETSTTLTDAQKKIWLLEARMAESQAQQAALEQLYTELSRNRDEAQAAEIEQLVLLAAQQLQLAGNVSGALILLQSADTRLARVDRPQFLAVRRALASDIDRLRSLPSTDLSGFILRIDQLLQNIDALPLLGEAQITPVAPPSTPDPVWWRRMAKNFLTEIRQLVRVRKIDHPDAVLLTPPQAYFARENLKLRLLNARLQLLTRHESAFRHDLAESVTLVGKYFDAQHPQVQTMLQTLDQLQKAEVVVALPELTASLNAVSHFRPDKAASRIPAKGS
jgi:uroporphyrin-3 C-methyltransferase/uroporphyrinogen III methyltransferase/synthase